jgi:hypothetical protein
LESDGVLTHGGHCQPDPAPPYVSGSADAEDFAEGQQLFQVTDNSGPSGASSCFRSSTPFNVDNIVGSVGERIMPDADSPVARNSLAPETSSLARTVETRLARPPPVNSGWQ